MKCNLKINYFFPCNIQFYAVIDFSLYLYMYQELQQNFLFSDLFLEIRDTKTLNLSGNIVSLQVFANVSRFSPCVTNLTHNKNICCWSKEVFAKSRARVYFEQQILALQLLVFHQTHNLSRNKFARALANQPIRVPHVFSPQQMFSLRVKLITPGDKREERRKLAMKQCCATS